MEVSKFPFLVILQSDSDIASFLRQSFKLLILFAYNIILCQMGSLEFLTSLLLDSSFFKNCDYFFVFCYILKVMHLNIVISSNC